VETRPVAEGGLRPSFLVMAVGLGLGAGFAAFDRTGSGWAAFTVGMKAFGYTLAALFSLPVLNWIFGGLAAAWAARDALQAEAPAPTAPTVPTHVSLVDDLADTERYVQDGLRLTLEHARAAGGLTWDKIGYAFGKTQHWVWWTNILAASRLVDKANGLPTVLPPGRTYAWALRQVRLGYFEMPEMDSDTPLPPLPVVLDAARAERGKPVTA
jgi:hypothetical protein